ncbi:class II fructose-bisphosphate aldolase [Sporosarcina sp. Marseille-Q4063]|uniref:class II fructose-bisphosphate aldolase n=1 Tax=Sporosarcina sp. Marseille-Q4063 TaxID=2810514 RepID=UPI001BAEAE10|nr:class II fructose-bisphosphate aldolase [Sporosarcina sp. Marseille-Q4063]QUW21269.1 class II fructose-bisphosphate aldolase [Sporosarcina sp. Marseille-Q4063]
MQQKNTKEVLEKARREGYAVGAFNPHNLETIKAILLASEELRAPVIIQIGQKMINRYGMEESVNVIKAIGKSIDATVSIHLDHGNSIEQAESAIHSGFQSVMYDGSHLSIEENVKNTKKVIEIAKAHGIPVEGEIGQIPGVEDEVHVSEDEASITTLEEAIEFVNLTNIDFFAFSIGTAHGVYTKEPYIHFDRLREIAGVVSHPLVLHGGSGISDEMIRKSISLGIAKINVDTDLRLKFKESITKSITENSYGHLTDLLDQAVYDVKEKVKEKIILFGSENQV